MHTANIDCEPTVGNFANSKYVHGTLTLKIRSAICNSRRSTLNDLQGTSDQTLQQLRIYRRIRLDPCPVTLIQMSLFPVGDSRPFYFLERVQLDSSLMHGPTRGAGAVAAIEGVKRPSLVALDVMRYTDHHLLVGEGAQRFAASMGHKIEDLLTDESRRRWIEWRARLSDQDDYLLPEESGERIGRFRTPDEFGDGLLDSHDGIRPQGTINCDIVDANGDISSVTTTSGLAYKIPGRVGDSPIIGAGQYCDNDVGAAGSTGRGEAVIKTCGSHTIVEMMRNGMHPKDACLEALRRIVHVTVESRLKGDDGRPNFSVNYYAVNKNGEYGGAAIWSGARYAVSVDGASRHEDSAYLFERA